MCIKRFAALTAVVCGMAGLVAAAPAVALRAIPSVECMTPQKTLYEKQIHANGTIEARQMREIYLETPVIASSVPVSVGDSVRKGQVIAVIDSELTRGILEQSIDASALIGGLSAEGLSSELSELTELYSALQSSGLGAGLGDNPLDTLVQEVYNAAGQAQPANHYLYIPEAVIAPMDGVITQIGIQSHVLSRTAKPIVTISSPDQFAVMVTVGESLVSSIREGDPATITGTGFSGSYQGHVRKIYPTARKAASVSQEAVVDLEIAIDNPDEALKAGFTARASIFTGQRRDMLTVPYEAVQQDEQNVEYVYIAQGSRAVRRDIRTGMELLEGIEVLSGLSADDVLICNAAAVQGHLSGRIHLKRGGSDAA